MTSIEKLREACGTAQWYQIVREAAWMYPPELSPQTVALLLDVISGLDDLLEAGLTFDPESTPEQIDAYKSLYEKRKALDEHLGGGE